MYFLKSPAPPAGLHFLGVDFHVVVFFLKKSWAKVLTNKKVIVSLSYQSHEKEKAMTTQEILSANFWSSYRDTTTYYSNSAYLQIAAANGKFYVSGNRFSEDGKIAEEVVKTFGNKNEAEEFVANLIK